MKKPALKPFFDGVFDKVPIQCLKEFVFNSNAKREEFEIKVIKNLTINKCVSLLAAKKQCDWRKKQESNYNSSSGIKVPISSSMIGKDHKNDRDFALIEISELWKPWEYRLPSNRIFYIVFQQVLKLFSKNSSNWMKICAA